MFLITTGFASTDEDDVIDYDVDACKRSIISIREKMDELVNKAKDIDMEEVKETFERKVDEVFNQIRRNLKGKTDEYSIVKEIYEYIWKELKDYE